MSNVCLCAWQAVVPSTRAGEAKAEDALPQLRASAAFHTTVIVLAMLAARASGFHASMLLKRLWSNLSCACSGAGVCLPWMGVLCGEVAPKDAPTYFQDQIATRDYGHASEAASCREPRRHTCTGTCFSAAAAAADAAAASLVRPSWIGRHYSFDNVGCEFL
jgi:hypothetical protein